MAARIRTSGLGAGRNHLLWPALLLLVLVPTVCVLWLTGAAVRSARVAMRQTLLEAYEDHLALVRARVEAAFRDKAAALSAFDSEAAGAAVFARLVRSGVADGVVCYDADGEPSYPAAAMPPESLPRVREAAWREAERLEYAENRLEEAADAYAAIAEETSDPDEAAQAWQAQARSLAGAGRREAAIGVLVDTLGQDEYRQAVDRQGRWSAADARLRALQLMPDRAAEECRANAEKLAGWLNDYDGPGLPSAQRWFLMRQLGAILPDVADFPTLRAEELAARHAESRSAKPNDSALRATKVPGLWQVASPDGRVVALFETASVVRQARAAVDSATLPDGVSIAFLPPDEEPLAEESVASLSTGDPLPGWRLSLSLGDRTRLDSAADAQTAMYLWTGILVVAATSLLAVLVGTVLHRQLRATRLKNDLVATVSHELKTPLSSIRLLVDTLLDEDQLDSPKTREYLQLVANENLRLTRLIDNFLAFSRMERCRHAFEFEEVSPAEIVADAVEALQERFDRPGCRFEVDVADDLPPLRADREAIVTVLVNFLDNAYKYSGEEKHIVLRAAASDEQVRFEVSDNGIGLTRAASRRVFNRFYQVDRRLSREGGGCGLGLSIVKFIVTDHGGTVHVVSRPGHGSTFTICIPVENRHANPQEVT